MMRSASRQALVTLGDDQRQAFSSVQDVSEFAQLADQLYAVAALFVAQPRLRRTVGDPATSADSRADLVERLLAGKIDDRALQLVKAAARQRWSSPWDLTDTLESLGDEALFASAEQDGLLDSVEDELFRFERILDSEGEATALLDEVSAPVARRVGFLNQLVEGKVSAPTLAMLRHAVASERKRTITLAIDDLIERAAARKEQTIARVLSAVPLTDEQEQRLAAVLTDLYRRRISVRTAVDPSVRGGLVVRIGDEVIDGSIATRLAAARAGLGG